MRFNEHSLIDSNNHTLIKSYHSSRRPEKLDYREHHHTECELSVILSGSGIYLVHERTYEFHPGDMFLFGSNEAHCITDIFEELDILNIHFEPRLLWEHSETTELLNLFAARSKSFRNRLPKEDTALRELILELEGEISEKQDCYVIRAKYLLFSALVHILRRYDWVDQQRAISAPSSVTRSLKRSIDHINENLENKLTLKEIADVACMTPNYFSSVFKKFNGISPWEYITIKRVEKAVEMLRTTDMTKLEIAEQCGFSGSSNFYKAFFRVTGKRPGDYT